MHLAAQTEFDCLPRAPVAGQIIRAENAGWITDEFGCGDTGRYLRTGEEIRSWPSAPMSRPACPKTGGPLPATFSSVTLSASAQKAFSQAPMVPGAIRAMPMVALVLVPC
jgi:hypothetical protein